MITVNAVFGQEEKSLGTIGRVGENETRQIVFDCSDILAEYPGAEIVCVMQRHCDRIAYLADAVLEGNVLTVTLTDADVSAPGDLRIELRALADGKIRKSAVYMGQVVSALRGEQDRPGNPAADLLNRIDSTLQSATETQKKLLSALYGVDTAVDGANAAADNAQTIADTVQKKLDNGDFVGAKGDKGEPGNVQDVRVAGVSVLTDGVANVPNVICIRDDKSIGVVNPPQSTVWEGLIGISANTGRIILAPSTQATINNRGSQLIGGNTLDYAVKAAMCDGKGAAWTANEQKAARERIGIDKPYELIEEITLTEGVKQIDRLNFGYAVSSLFGCVELPVVTAPFGFFMAALWDGDSYTTGYRFGLKEAESSIRFELAIHNGIITGQCQGSGKGWGSGIIYGVNNAASLKYCDKITGVKFYAPEADAVIPANAIVRIYGVRV